MRIISESFGRLSFWFFGFAIILMRLPAMNFLTDSPLLNSYNIAGYLLFSMFMFRLVENYVYGRKSAVPSSISFPIGLYFASQGLSVLAAVNVNEFLANYKDLVFAVLLFFVALWEIDSKKKLFQTLWIIVFSVIINLGIGAATYFQLPFENLLKSIFTPDYLRDLNINADRNRFFVDSYDAALVPILFVFVVLSKKLYEKIGYALLVFSVTIFAFLSNFRAQLIILFLSVLSSGYVYLKKKSHLFLIAPVVILVFYIINIVTAAGLGYNGLDRLVSPENEDYVSVTDRFYYWGLATEMGRSSPITGVGLGNFFDHLPVNKNANLSLFDPKNDFFKITWVHPHNIFFGTFAETGYFGLFALLLLLWAFVKSDFVNLFNGRNLAINLLITSFWMLFLFSIINPPLSFAYIGLLWLIRALIVVSTANKELVA